MASGIFALFDDIALLADDIALTAKFAAKKTVGLLGDDLAVNAEKAMGFAQKRELAIIWSITKGSFVNKAIILPAAFLLTYFLPPVLSFILICGGIYLSTEAMEKIFHVLVPHTPAREKEHKEKLKQSTRDNVMDVEKQRVRSALITDFILSIEIVIVTLSTVMTKDFFIQVTTTTIIAMGATIGVYGVVALIVRIDNIGFWLIKKGFTRLGRGCVSLMPILIRILGIIGTAAMLLVGGGILFHNIPLLHHLAINSLPNMGNHMISGAIVGSVFCLLLLPIKKYVLSSEKKKPFHEKI